MYGLKSLWEGFNNLDLGIQIGLISLFVAVIGIIITLFNPEIRRKIGIGKPLKEKKTESELAISQQAFAEIATNLSLTGSECIIAIGRLTDQKVLAKIATSLDFPPNERSFASLRLDQLSRYSK